MVLQPHGATNTYNGIVGIWGLSNCRNTEKEIAINQLIEQLHNQNNLIISKERKRRESTQVKLYHIM